MPLLHSLLSRAAAARCRPATCESEPSSSTSQPTPISSFMDRVGFGDLMGKLKRSAASSSPEQSSTTASKPSSSETSIPSVPVVDSSSSPASPPSSDAPHSTPTKSSKVSDGLIPVQYEQYGKEFMQITSQDNFDGFRLEASKQVTPQLQASHSFFLGTTMREEGHIYQFGPTFALDDGGLFLMGRYGDDGVTTARAAKKIGSSTEARLSASSSLQKEQRNMFELAFDHSGSSWASSIKAAWQGTWILNSTFSQILTPYLQMGGDCTFIASNGASIGSTGIRYRPNNGDVFSASVTRQPNFKSPTGLIQNVHSCKVQYFKKISDRLSLGTELEISEEKPGIESALRFGYEYLFRQARIQGLVDTAGKVSVYAQDATGFGVSGMIDYWKSNYRFGFVMQIIPPPPPEMQHGQL